MMRFVTAFSVHNKNHSPIKKLLFSVSYKATNETSLKLRMELSSLSESKLHFGSHKVPAVGFGTYSLNGEIGLTAIKHAIEVGYRLIDTAHSYQNEAVVGQARKV